MQRNTFKVFLVTPEEVFKELNWPEGVSLPCWGETFYWENVPYAVEETEWRYDRRLDGVDIAYFIFLVDSVTGNDD